MKPNWKAVAVGLLILAQTAAAVAQTPTTRPAAWQADLQVLSDNLKTLHPNFFTVTSRETFDNAVARLQQDIPAMPEPRIVAELARITALGRDAHTWISLFPQSLGLRRYPLQLQWLADGLFVSGVTADSSRALKARVLRINGIEIQDALNAITPYISHENGSWLRFISQDYLVTADVLWAAGVIGGPVPTAFSFEGPDGSRFDLTLTPFTGTLPVNWITAPSPDQLPLFMRDRNLNYWLHYLSESKTLYFKYNQCADSPGLPFSVFTQQILRFAEENTVNRLIVDLRNNTGGNSALINPLFQGLALLAIQGKIRLDTPFRVIIGRETFSSGMLNAIEFKTSGGATLIGEPTGGKPSGYGEVRSFRLPNTNINVSYSTRLFTIPGFDGLSVEPDVNALPTAAQYFASIDPALDAALEGAATSTDFAPFSLYANGSTSWRTAGDASVPRAGFAEFVTAGTDIAPMGLAIFSLRLGGAVISEATVPAAVASRAGRLFAEAGAVARTGIALANPGTRDTVVNFSFVDDAGLETRSGQFTLPARSQSAKFLNEAPFDGGAFDSGSFSYTASEPVAAVGLRGFTNERGEFLMSTIPVADPAGTPPAGTRLLAHFADGGGWTTDVMLVNTTEQTVSGTIEFAANSGDRVTIDAVTGSSFPYSLPPRAARRLRTSGAGTAVRSGYIRIVPGAGNPAPSGSSLFRFRAGGITVSEATVPAAGTSGTMVFAVEASGAFAASAPGSIMSGIALANPSDAPVQVSLRLLNSGGSAIRTAATLTVAARAQTAVFLNQVPGWETLTTPFRGTLSLSSPTPVAATGLRARYNERGDFLITATPALERISQGSFPQVADSGGFSTEFILADPGDARRAFGLLRLIQQNGTPLVIPLR